MPEAGFGVSAAPSKTSEGRAAAVERLITPTLDAMGFDVVRVILSGSRNALLQIMAERKSDGGMSVEDCASVSRAVSALLDVEDPIEGAYSLEVSSPGLDRPLTRLADFERFKGLEAKVEMQLPIDGRRRFTGRLAGLRDGRILIATEQGQAELPFADLARAKLLLTDELLAAHQAASAGQDEGGNQGLN